MAATAGYVPGRPAGRTRRSARFRLRLGLALALLASACMGGILHLSILLPRGLPPAAHAARVAPALQDAVVAAVDPTFYQRPGPGLSGVWRALRGRGLPYQVALALMPVSNSRLEWLAVSLYAIRLECLYSKDELVSAFLWTNSALGRMLLE